MTMLSLLAAVLLDQSTLAHRSATVEANVKGLYSAKTSFPVFQSTGPLAKAANSRLALAARSEHDRFVKEAAKDTADLRREGSKIEYTHEASYEVHAASDRLVSVSLSIAQYTGGAHGNLGLTVHTLALDDRGRPVVLRLRDVLRPGIDPATTVGPEIMASILRSGKPNWVEDGTVRDLPAASLDRFVVTSRGLLWLFPPYEMGPWSSGVFEVLLTREQIDPWVRPNSPVRSAWR